ncbi:MAG TPA: alpha/beta fold hydrolase [Candidatus Udaeobacter sp.]|jgi:triacylglycerol esterase/lipase EstA (alpha/beta hydrolase family)|nr:alpha/beta fold hydrolase [Candidatus Udaeobacter sp.]
MSRINLSHKFSLIKTSQTDIILVAALATLGACAPLAQVREINPKSGAQYATGPQFHRAEEAIANGEQLQRSDPKKAVGFYLSGIESATSELRKNPRDRFALRDYDFALSRVFSVIRDAHLDPWTHSLHVPTPNDTEYILTQRPSANRLWKPQYFDLIPADELDVRGKLVIPRIIRAGAGAALVAVRSEQAPEIPHRFVPPRIYLGATAVAHFSGRKCELEFVDPLSVERVSVAGRSLPSAADFTAPLALGLARERPEKIGVPALLNPEKFAGKARLIQIQPYDPKKIPVLLVHGLKSTPVTWVPMVNALWADPVLRRNYQVWVFNYPTGYPVPYSAMLLRRQLNALDKAFPNHRPIVVVGHSMGGIISRLMITDSRGDKVWRYFFGTSPARTTLSPESKVLLKETLIFRPQRDVARVVFISTPHRGSVIAQGTIGRIASGLIHKSVEFVKLGPEIMQASVVQQDPGVMKLKRMPNSIDTLSPKDAWVKIVNTLPLAKKVPYHSIIGDRGRGDTPNSSDGVVPYWSSHLDGAESEKIVPSAHGANETREGIAEVIRILKEHTENNGSVRKTRPTISTKGELDASVLR